MFFHIQFEKTQLLKEFLSNKKVKHIFLELMVLVRSCSNEEGEEGHPPVHVDVNILDLLQRFGRDHNNIALVGLSILICRFQI